VEKEPQKENQDEKDLQSDKWSKPVVMSEGCQEGHDFQPDYIDAENRQHYQCKNCWQGKLENIK
jgi:hypothetical protein